MVSFDRQVTWREIVKNGDEEDTRQQAGDKRPQEMRKYRMMRRAKREQLTQLQLYLEIIEKLSPFHSQVEVRRDTCYTISLFVSCNNAGQGEGQEERETPVRDQGTKQKGGERRGENSYLDTFHRFVHSAGFLYVNFCSIYAARLIKRGKKVTSRR